MGIYLNPTYENFKEALAAEIYVDKTMMIDQINRFIDIGNKYICISRPRRFGKTIASEMLSAFYSKGYDTRELFSKLDIAKVSEAYEKQNAYNVIKIDLNGQYQLVENKEDMFHVLARDVRDEMRDGFPDVEFHDDDSIGQCILRVYAKKHEQFIIIIDEYDVLVREEVSPELFSIYLSFLNGLFKNNVLRPAIALAYLTGILPVVRDRIQSKLNNFKEYTILDAKELAPYIGFTDEEVRKLCEEYKADYELCRRWYDGYRQYEYEIYNPESVVEMVLSNRVGSYWGKTSSYAAVAERIRLDFDGTRDSVVRMVSGESVDVHYGSFMNTMDSFKTRDDVFTYLIHIGYLAYDRAADFNVEGTCRVPNLEIMQEWRYVLADDANYSVTNSIVNASKQLLADTIEGNERAVEKALDASHIHVTSNRSYNNEDALASAIYLAYFYALNEYTVIREVTAGAGFADVIYIPVSKEKPALIIELKRNGTTGTALEQIKSKRYFDALPHYQGKLLLVAINYDEKSKTHTAEIQYFQTQLLKMKNS